MNHKICYLFLNGYYTVAAASDMLMRYHIDNRIVKAPASLRGSCNFTVQIDVKDLEMAAYVLRREQIHINRIETVEKNKEI